eukprot:698169_1
MLTVVVMLTVSVSLSQSQADPKAFSNHDHDTKTLTLHEYEDLDLSKVADSVTEASYYQCELSIITQKLIEIGVAGANVFDAACGTGRWSRISAQLGAKKVVGVDLSPQQIETANALKRNATNSDSDILEYSVHDMNEALPDEFVNKFDIVINIHLLCYASSENMIYNFYRNMRSAFSTGTGTTKHMITLMENYDLDPFAYHKHVKYGWIKQIAPDDYYLYHKHGSLRNGTQIKIHGFEPEYKMTVWVYSKQMHEKYLTKAGFTNVKWFHFNCNEMEFYNDQNTREFVKDYYDHQTNVGFVAAINDENKCVDEDTCDL